MSVANCNQCGKLFYKTVRNICLDCVKKEEEDFEIVCQYLRENRGAQLDTMVKDTGVSRNTILKFIREGRLMDIKGLSYPCHLCHSPIETGKICSLCQKQVNQLERQSTSLTSSQTFTPRRSGFFTKHNYDDSLKN